MPVKLNSFTHLRVLLVLHDRGILTHVTISLGIIPPSEVTHQLFVWRFVC